MMKLTLAPTALAAVVFAAPGSRPMAPPIGDSPATALHDITDYDEIVAHILTMTDLLSSGIVKQFPEKFASKP